jgi:hypothetical protein
MWFGKKTDNAIVLFADRGLKISIVPWRLNKIYFFANTEVEDIVDAHFRAMNWYDSYLGSLLKQNIHMDSYARKLLSVGIIEWNFAETRDRILRIAKSILKRLGLAKSTRTGGE